MLTEPLTTHGPAYPRAVALGIVVLVLAACLPFARTLGHELVWDDHYLVADVAACDREGGLSAVAAAPFLPEQNDPDNYYRPVTNLSLWLDGRLGGGSAAAYHATNLLLHVLNALLVGRLLVLLLGVGFGALSGAVLFAAHPVQVETVAFTAARTDLWATFFVLLATMAWMASRRKGLPAGRRALLLTGVACAYAAGALAKETAIVLPLVLAAWDALGVGRGEAAPANWWTRNRAAAVAFAVALGLVAGARAHALGAVLVTGGPAASLQGPLAIREPGLALAAAVRLLGLLVVPWPLNSLYTREHLVLGAVSSVAAALLVAGVIWLGRTRLGRIGWVAAAWIGIFLAPALLVPSGSATLAAERYLYLPAVGFALLAGAACGLLTPLRPSVRRVAWGLVTVLLVSLGTMSAVRAAVWRDDLTLTADQLRTAPRSAFAHDLHGQALLARERWAEALEQFRQAVALEPADAGYHNDLGIALRRVRRPELAVGAFHESLRLDPGVAGTRLNLAYACITLRDVACIEEQRTALAALDPRALATLDAELERWRLRPGGGR